MDMSEVDNYLSQYSEGKITYEEAELRRLLGHTLLDKAKETEKAKGLIGKMIYATIATSNKNALPWVTAVCFACDKDYNFYWVSSKKTVHSTNIEENEDIAMMIYDTSMPAGKGMGVYIKAKARRLDDKAEIKAALKLLYGRKRRPPPPDIRVHTRRPEERVQGDNQHLTALGMGE